jgi:phosphoglycolate phosphatase-like HAD superfamily hydrolase
MPPTPPAGAEPALIAVDSDGCVFDTMAAKQIRCFHPEIIRCWGWEAVAPLVRETAEFVNLRSAWRGSNRFVALLKTFELLAERPEFTAAGAPPPPTDALRRFVESGYPLSNERLRRLAEETGDVELRRLLDWSRAVNARVAREASSGAPFPGAPEALRAAAEGGAILIVVSQTPEETLEREWRESGLRALVRTVWGQERGTKAEMLRRAAAQWGARRLLMIGDAPGDLRAARAGGAAFYPILPNGEEAASWARFRTEVLPRFLRHAWTSADASAIVARFERLLPETPPWRPPDFQA